MTFDETLTVADNLWLPTATKLPDDCDSCARSVAAGAHSSKTVLRIKAEIEKWLTAKAEALVSTYCRALRESQPEFPINAVDIVREHITSKFSEVAHVASSVLNNWKLRTRMQETLKAINLEKEIDTRLAAVLAEISLAVRVQNTTTRNEDRIMNAAEDSVASLPDAFKRRYQVFVSSTYEDLIEERRHVIHALLETKCIPSGMEMFPASSEEKWSRIKKVIDDCDYFISIVAGKYGSYGSTDKSFTEMEFDYAVEKGKPVLGFFHGNLDSLSVAKSEKSEEAQAKLQGFLSKLKSRNIGHPWQTPQSAC